MKRNALATHLGWLLTVSCLPGIAQARQFICTATVAYSSEADGKLTVNKGELKGSQTLFTVDTSTGIVQGDRVVPPGTYTVAYPGTGVDGAKLLRIDAARLEVIFVATNARSPYPFLFTDGSVTLAGTCRPSS